MLGFGVELLAPELPELVLPELVEDFLVVVLLVAFSVAFFVVSAGSLTGSVVLVAGTVVEGSTGADVVEKVCSIASASCALSPELPDLAAVAGALLTEAPTAMLTAAATRTTLQATTVETLAVLFVLILFKNNLILSFMVLLL